MFLFMKVKPPVQGMHAVVFWNIN